MIRDFLDLLGRRLAGAVAGARLDACQYGSVAGLAVLQLGDELEAVRRHHAIIRVRRRHECRRIFCALFEIMIGRIGVKRLELFRVLRAIRNRPPRSGRR